MANSATEDAAMHHTVAVLVVCANELQDQLPKLSEADRPPIEKLLRAIELVGRKLLVGGSDA